MLTHLHPPPDETTTLPPPLLTLLHPHLIFSLAYNPCAPAGPSSYASNAALTHPYASLHPPLTILTLVECLPDMSPTTLTILTLMECLPNMPPTLLTILTRMECLPDMPLTLLTILTLV
ncbi:hypothetical protein O181_130523 [Austropuccinia psidii MF-1]|uniref:Uncharacterized protein n=1 Tax=Austropuccinia psidii MF-1 TaxID=1389203 RepID=A0A9Q3Q9W0_9BASI|nr:hypothetical protein [Austropuccinia psidii MF-1]